jgi:hypothetical protein
MGKKSKFKEMRRIAAGLPPLKQKAVKVSLVKGSELLEEGIDKTQSGNSIVSSHEYKEKKRYWYKPITTEE